MPIFKDSKALEYCSRIRDMIDTTISDIRSASTLLYLTSIDVVALRRVMTSKASAVISRQSKLKGKHMEIACDVLLLKYLNYLKMKMGLTICTQYKDQDYVEDSDGGINLKLQSNSKLPARRKPVNAKYNLSAQQIVNLRNIVFSTVL